MAERLPIPGDPGLARFPKFLFTDASCRVPRTDGDKAAAAWAAILVTGEDSAFHSAVIRRRAKDVTYCELLAVALALQHFTTCGQVVRDDALVVCLDNQSAIQLLSTDQPCRDPDKALEGARAHVRHLEHTMGLRLRYSWVPAHQGMNTNDWRGLVHARVDRHARWLAGRELKRRNGLAEVLAP